MGKSIEWTWGNTDSDREAALSVAEQANSKEHPSFLLFSRMKDPVIFNQMVSLYFAHYRQKGNQNPDLREAIIAKLKERLTAVEKDTPITFDSQKHSSAGSPADLLEAGPIRREWIKVSSDEPGQGIVEAHEKGHIIRLFYGEYFNAHFMSGFDPDSMEYDEAEFKRMHKRAGLNPEWSNYKDLIKDLKRHLFSPTEIAERMSQLKAYFGMKGHEEFTSEHLEYARRHYVEDTGANNWMQEFFSAITPATEEKFLQLINSSGI